MKTEARKMAEKMSKSKKNEDINEMAREINRGGKPRGISSDIPAGIREKLMEKERESLFKGEGNKYAKGGDVKKEQRFPPAGSGDAKIKERIRELSSESSKLRKQVAESSSPSSRILQTYGHLAGKKAGEASDYSIRKRENMKEEMAEDIEKQIEEKRKKLSKYAAGGMSTKQEAKVGKVMKEFKAGSLHSGKGGKVVKSPKQAVAIALSEARKAKK
jgi:hypothetical protein